MMLLLSPPLPLDPPPDSIRTILPTAAAAPDPLLPLLPLPLLPAAVEPPLPLPAPRAAGAAAACVRDLKIGAPLSTAPTDKLPLRGLIAGLLAAGVLLAEPRPPAMPGMREDSLPAAAATTRAALLLAAAAPAGRLLAADAIAACTAGNPAVLPALLLAVLALKLPKRAGGVAAAAAAAPRGLGGALALGEAGTDDVVSDALRDAVGLSGMLRPKALLGVPPADALGELAAAAAAAACSRGDAAAFGLDSCNRRGETP